MRLGWLDVLGFRAFGERQTFDVSADTVIVAGANGQGKTSLLDAIFWNLTGRVPRMESTAPVVSVFGDSGEARVALTLHSSDGLQCTVVRSSDGTRSQLSLELSGETHRGTTAQARLFELLWQPALDASEPEEAFVASLQRAIYLQQDRVRDFVEATNDEERFAAVSELLGTGRVRELQLALENSRRAWSTVTNSRKRETEELEGKLEDLQSQLEQFEIGSIGIDGQHWSQWWAALREFNLGQSEPPSPESREAASAVDLAVKELRTFTNQLTSERQDVLLLLDAVTSLGPEPSDNIEALRAAAADAARAVQAAREELTHAQRRAAEQRRAQVEASERQQRMRALAALALDFLGEKCPVCGQDYDHDETAHRLISIREGAGEVPQEDFRVPDVTSIAEAVENREERAAEATDALRAAEQRASQWHRRRGELVTQLLRFGLNEDNSAAWTSQLSALAQRLESQLAELERLRDDGEATALGIARMSQHARRAEVERELSALSERLHALRDETAERERTGQFASSIINALREAGSDIVDQQLERLDPLLQRIYAAVDPHPAFRVAKLLSRMHRGHGRLTPSLEDPVFERSTDDPAAILSSSQTNVLAVSIFLTLNLGMPTLPLRTVVLDDPLQSLDDVNLLGLVDLLRRTRDHRQLIVSTHDDRFARLLERKLRPVVGDQRTRIIELAGWQRSGPTVWQREIERDASPLRMVS